MLVNGACNLAALAVEAENYDLAQWGLERARLVDPYSEALSRAAMQVAAAEGDADRLRREWRECQRRIDELDPGSSPSPRTERLYGELAQAGRQLTAPSDGARPTPSGQRGVPDGPPVGGQHLFESGHPAPLEEQRVAGRKGAGQVDRPARRSRPESGPYRSVW